MAGKVNVALNVKQIEYAGLVKEVYDYSGGTMKAVLRHAERTCSVCSLAVVDDREEEGELDHK